MSIGLAKTFFTELYQRNPWKEKPLETFPSHWHFLNQLYTQQKISYLDYILTLRLLRSYFDHCQEEAAICLFHLILSARQGHLCIRIEDGIIVPSPESVWLQENGNPISAQEVQELNHSICKGFNLIPRRLLTLIQSEDTQTFPPTPLCRYGSSLYFQRHWIFESTILQYLKEHLAATPSLPIHKEAAQASIEQLIESNILLPEQAEAILKGCLQTFSLITGGPGTGKTYTAGHLIKIFYAQLSLEQKQQCEIVLTAPTGKAVANLQKSLSQALSHLKEQPALIAKTLHALLNLKSHQMGYEVDLPYLSADVIIVDESSMIDVRLMALLFKAVKKGARLILLGDEHQLPSVEAGSLFADLIRLANKKLNPIIACTKLKTCLRVELQAILAFAHAINQGNASAALNLLNRSEHVGLKYIPLSLNKEEDLNTLLNETLKHFFNISRNPGNAEEVIHLFNHVRILSPLRRGSYGVDHLNQQLWKLISQKAAKTGWIPIPIMITVNDYRQNLFNGEAGVLMRQLPIQETDDPICMGDYALFTKKNHLGQTEILKIPALLLPKYEYAYCLSVHKSQGSEFEHVILVMPEGAELFGREILYTAVTRARKRLDVYSSENVLAKTILQKGLRLSGIVERYTDE